jgi:hypothetical protein
MGLAGEILGAGSVSDCAAKGGSPGDLGRDGTRLDRSPARILLLMVFHEVPMDEVAQQLNTNRNAIYKSLHDARRKLKHGLQARGFEVGEMLSLFDARQ